VDKKIDSILFSIYDKSAFTQYLPLLWNTEKHLIATDGTHRYFEGEGIKATHIEEITKFPPILSGRVKSINPKLIGGIVSERTAEHNAQRNDHNIPQIDCVVVDLYPFLETWKNTSDEELLIKKIDIGGVTMLRAAAKHYREVTVIPSKKSFFELKSILGQGGVTSLHKRIHLAKEAFRISAEYDRHIFEFYEENCRECEKID